MLALPNGYMVVHNDFFFLGQFFTMIPMRGNWWILLRNDSGWKLVVIVYKMNTIVSECNNW